LSKAETILSGVTLSLSLRLTCKPWKIRVRTRTAHLQQTQHCLARR